jgi:amino acid transporter
VAFAWRKALLGRPIPTRAAGHQRLTRPRALGAFGLDALSSVAYGPDEILYVLLLAGAAGTQFDVPIAIAITGLLAIVVTSYQQTIYAYPQGGGSYTVARENLGTAAGLTAAAALLVDYLTTVAVSVTAGIQALIALAPGLDPYRVPLDVACIALLVVANLRGLREAGALFVFPTYLFIGSLGLVVVWGALHLVTGGLPHAPTTAPHAVEGVTLFLILRAFAGGCTAMTGVEAVANGVPVFEPPESRNAATTLLILGGILGVLFLGITFLGHAIGAVPSNQANVSAQVTQAVSGRGVIFVVVQISSAAILALAANTSFNGFPLLAAILAHDEYLPEQFKHRGLRLAYSNGIVVLGLLAIGLVVVFQGSTHSLIPLFAIGVFLCFTLSQAGMVRHWLRHRGRRWQLKLAINGTGAVVTGIVTLIVVITKFPEGAWIVVFLVPLEIAGFIVIHRHYADTRIEMETGHPPPLHPVRHRMIIPVAQFNRAVTDTVSYAVSIGGEVQAVHVAVDPDAAKQLQQQWATWAPTVPLMVIPSPYREVVAPVVQFVKDARTQDPDLRITVLLPEVIPRRWWQEPLHNQFAVTLELVLRHEPGIVITTVPLQLRH